MCIRGNAKAITPARIPMQILPASHGSRDQMSALAAQPALNVLLCWPASGCACSICGASSAPSPAEMRACLAPGRQSAAGHRPTGLRSGAAKIRPAADLQVAPWAISKPSLVSAMALWAVFGGVSPRRPLSPRYSSTQADAAAPPTRPRSWCSCDRQSARHARSPSGWRWARPRRPRSPVVLTSTPIAAGELRHHRLFLGRGMRECSRPTSRQAGPRSVGVRGRWRWTGPAPRFLRSAGRPSTPAARRPPGRRCARSPRLCGCRRRLVTMGVRPGGSSSMVETSRSA